LLALEGIRVLDLAPLGPGPHCAQILGDLGADVIKVEEPGTGTGRRAGRVLRFPEGAPIRRNARSIALNLKSDEGRDVFRRLVATADVVMEGYRPGTAARLGVDYESVRAIRPDIVYASLSGYGQSGPYAAYAGHDINYQGIAGILAMTGRSDGPPMIPGNTIADNAGGGMNAAISILAALLARERRGVGQFIDMAMVDGLVAMMSLTIDGYVETGELPRRGDTLLTGCYPWYNIYETGDGKHVSVGAIEPWFYENLCRLIGREDLAPHQYAEGEQRDEVFAAFRAAFRSKTRDEWVAELMPADTCVAPVYDIDEVVRDPQLRHREMIVDVDEGEGRRRTQVGVMVKLSETPGCIRRPGVGLGQDTAAILSELGYDDTATAALRDTGVVA
jgi:crotonobetainyl-CoA:carnitine CoA-transferase CaiB-like acyl-CoA transferase